MTTLTDTVKEAAKILDPVIDDFLNRYYRMHTGFILDTLCGGIRNTPSIKSLEERLKNVNDLASYSDFMAFFKFRNIEKVWIDGIKINYETIVKPALEELEKLYRGRLEKSSGLEASELKNINESYERNKNELISLFKERYSISEIDFELLSKGKPFRATQFAKFSLLQAKEHYQLIAKGVAQSLQAVSFRQIEVKEKIKSEEDLKEFFYSFYPIFQETVEFYKKHNFIESTHTSIRKEKFQNLISLIQKFKEQDYDMDFCAIELFKLCLPTKPLSLFKSFDDETCMYGYEHLYKKYPLKRGEIIMRHSGSAPVFTKSGEIVGCLPKDRFERILEVNNEYGHPKFRIRKNGWVNSTNVSRLFKIERKKFGRDIREELEFASLPELVVFNRDIYHKIPPLVPPVEKRAHVLRIEAAVGCPYSKCTFCAEDNKPKHELFPQEYIAQQKRKIVEYLGNNFEYIRRIFVVGSDTLAITPKKFLPIMEEINKPVNGYGFSKLPKRCYGNVSTIAHLDVDYLKQLKDLGLEVIFIGLESGSENVLRYVRKNTSEEEMYEAADKLREASIDVSLMIMPRLGEKRFYGEHTERTPKVVNHFEPKYLTFLTRTPTAEYNHVVENDQCNTWLEEHEVALQIFEWIKNLGYFDCRVTCADQEKTPLANNPIITRPFNLKEKYVVVFELDLFKYDSSLTTPVRIRR